MIEDKLTAGQRIRLESIAQANQVLNRDGHLMRAVPGAYPVHLGGPPDPVRELVGMAGQIEQYITGPQDPAVHVPCPGCAAQAEQARKRADFVVDSSGGVVQA